MTPKQPMETVLIREDLVPYPNQEQITAKDNAVMALQDLPEADLPERTGSVLSIRVPAHLIPDVKKIISTTSLEVISGYDVVATDYLERLERSLTAPQIGVAPGVNTPLHVIEARHKLEDAETAGEEVQALRERFNMASKAAYSKYASEAVDWVRKGLSNDGVQWSSTLIDDAASAIAEAKRQGVETSELETYLEELQEQPRPE